jgi:putative FmdB family regulatory protein
VPIYEYDCRGCRRRVSILVRSLSSQEAPRCPRCDSAELHRLMSRFATVKSEDARLDSLSDPSQFGDLDENDPRSVARMMKRMGDEMGEDLGEDLEGAMDEAMAEGDGDGQGNGQGNGMYGDGDGQGDGQGSRIYGGDGEGSMADAAGADEG